MQSSQKTHKWQMQTCRKRGTGVGRRKCQDPEGRVARMGDGTCRDLVFEAAGLLSTGVSNAQNIIMIITITTVIVIVVIIIMIKITIITTITTVMKSIIVVVVVIMVIVIKTKINSNSSNNNNDNDKFAFQLMTS